jgi:uncharacterized protein (TIGR04255 family)
MADEEHLNHADPPAGESVAVEVFPRAPVVEAILSFRFPPLDDIEYALPTLKADFADVFPHVEAVELPRSSRRPEKAFRFKSADERHVLRLSRTSFSFHRLRPYSDWQDLAAGAQSAWSHVCKRYDPEFVSAVSLRYLNKILLPVGKDMAEYITLCPSVPRSIDTGFSDYLLRLVLVDDVVPARAEITQVAGMGEDPPRTLTFDIDVITDAEEFLPESAQLWDQVGRLRDYKNRLFFSSITDACRELFR